MVRRLHAIAQFRQMRLGKMCL